MILVLIRLTLFDVETGEKGNSLSLLPGRLSNIQDTSAAAVQ